MHLVIVLKFNDLWRRLLTLIGNQVDAFEDLVHDHLIDDAQFIVHLLLDGLL